MIDLILFFGLALVAIAAAIGMLASQNAVYSALFLVINFATVAVFYLLLGAPFIALVQITVYAGAIMVLFLFVVMFFMSPKARQWLRPALKGQLVIGGILVVALLVLLMGSMGSVGTMTGEISSGDRERLVAEASEDTGPAGDPRPLGNWLFKHHVLPFELISILLLAAMIGALMVARDTRSEGRMDLDSDEKPQAEVEA